jgi:hypothetical protein
MTHRGDNVPLDGTYFTGAFGSLNVTENVNIIDLTNQKVLISLLQVAEDVENIKKVLLTIDDHLKRLIQKVQANEDKIEEIYYAPGMPGYLLHQAEFDENAAKLSISDA